MSATILYGKPVAEQILAGLKADIQKLDPKLVVIQVGNNPASESYIKQKLKSCEAVGLRSEHIHLDEMETFDELLRCIQTLNLDPDVTGFILQLPLPKHLQDKVPLLLREIDPMKDIDGFGAYNLGKMFLSKEFEHLPPATPAGVISLLEFYNIDVQGKHAVVIGHSNIVGKSLAIMLLNRNATVTVCHIHTKDLKHHTKQADLLFSATGVAGLVTKDMVKKGAVIIDIGISRTKDGLKGDTDFDALTKVASAITPVPGGVGPLTVASLIRNCVNAKKRQIKMKN